MQILHPRLQSSELPAVIRETGPALVEENQAERPGELLVEVAPVPRLPAIDEVRDEIGDVGEIGLAIAHDLVGDRDATVPRVPDVSRHNRIFSNAASAANLARPSRRWLRPLGQRAGMSLEGEPWR